MVPSPTAPELERLRRVLRRNRRQRLLGGTALGLAALAGFLAWPPAEGGTPHSLALLLAGAALWALGFAGLELLRGGDEDAWIGRLHREAERFVWVHYYKVESMPYGIRVGAWTTLYLCRDDREKVGLRCTERECRALMDDLRAVLPHATFGYSPTKAQWFEADPNLLRR